MKLYNVSVGSLILRFHIFTALIVTLGFLGYLYVGIVIGMILFLASIMGMQFGKDAKEKKSTSSLPLSLKEIHLPAHRYNLWHQRHHWTAHL